MPLADQVALNLATGVALRPGAGTAGGSLISFADYLGLMLRFGPLGRLRQSLAELTVAGEPHRRGAFAGFVRWFRQDLTGDEANDAVQAAREGTWLIRPLEPPNAFALHWRASEAFPPLVCHLR
jgi:hypothetical protein